ncbi:MAG: hypothetical protein AAF429_09270 [Pseudomonadota bacterium]
MKRIIITCGLALWAAVPALAEDNAAFCKRMAAEDKLEGRSAQDCECVYAQADQHLTPEMKTVFQQTHDEGVQGMEVMQRMMAVGDQADIIARMEAYSGAIDANCQIN